MPRLLAALAMLPLTGIQPGPDGARIARRGAWHGDGNSRPRKLSRSYGHKPKGRTLANAAWCKCLTPEGRALPRNLRRAVAGVRKPLRASEYDALHAIVRRERAA